MLIIVVHLQLSVGERAEQMYSVSLRFRRRGGGGRRGSSGSDSGGGPPPLRVYSSLDSEAGADDPEDGQEAQVMLDNAEPHRNS